MNASLWLHNDFTHAFGLTLLHFIWQGALIALALSIALAGMRAMSAQSRYLACGIALLAMALAPGITMLAVYSGMEHLQAIGEPLAQGANPGTDTAAGVVARDSSVEPSVYIADAATGGPDTGWRGLLVARIESHLHWFVMIWLLGVCALSLWNFGGYLAAQRLRRRDVEPIAGDWQARLAELAARLGIARAVELLESARVDVPTVMGALKPVILLPASALTGLSASQLEAVLLHELAHIRRHDYLFNLLQAGIETLLFYHPAVWWVSARIREEREHCCDDIVLRVHDDPRGYVVALTALETLRVNDRPLALAATDGPLLIRVRRILGHRAASPRRRVSGMVAALLPAAMILAGGVAVYANRQIQPVDAPSSSFVAETNEAGPATPEAFLAATVDEAESPALGAVEMDAVESVASASHRPMSGGEVVVEVHLDRPMIALLAATMQAQGKPGADVFADTGIERLDLEIVRRDGTLEIEQDFNALSRQMIGEGWVPFIRVPAEKASVLIRTGGEAITGVKVLVDNGDDLVHLELAGQIDPNLFGRKLGRLLAMIGQGEFDAGIFRQLME